VNFTTREITCKIVYYGPGRSGKTTNLHYIYGRVPDSRRGRMVSLATQTDRTLFFDFLPIDLGQISGFSTRFQLYTVPGQVYYNATRRLVLQGADGVVFVGDSQARQLDENPESPGAAYNPLFIYSGSGLGKTHLLMAVGHAAKKAAPKLNIEYLTLDEYVEAFHASVAAGQGDAFRRRFQNVDVLLVDDVQFLTNRKEMQSELLRLTEALQAAGRQIVLTSDRPPPDIADLDERLISRLSGGLVVDMGTPDYETRVAILRRKAEERGARFEPGVLETVAQAEVGNVRELMGALNRLEALRQRDAPAAVDAAIAAFAEDVERLKALEEEVAELDPQAAGQSVFRDPERLSEAEDAAAKVRGGAAPPPGPSAAFPLAAFAVGPSNQVAVSAARGGREGAGRKC